MFRVGPRLLADEGVGMGPSVAGPRASDCFRVIGVGWGCEDDEASGVGCVMGAGVVDVAGASSCCSCTASLKSSLVIRGDTGGSAISVGRSTAEMVVGCVSEATAGCAAPATASDCEAIVHSSKLSKILDLRIPVFSLQWPRAKKRSSVPGSGSSSWV